MKVMGTTATIWPDSAWMPSTRSWYCFWCFEVWASSGIAAPESISNAADASRAARHLLRSVTGHLSAQIQHPAPRRRGTGNQGGKLIGGETECQDGRLLEREAAIHDQGLAGDVPRGIAAKEGDDVGDVLRLGQPAEHRVLLRPLGHFLRAASPSARCG